MNIFDDITSIKGVGNKTKEMFNKCGINTVLDLVLYFPREYENINNASLNNLAINEINILKVTVKNIYKDIRKNGKLITTIEFRERNLTITGKWFNQSYIKRRFILGKEYLLEGKIDLFNNRYYIINGKIINTDKEIQCIRSIYALKGDITNNIFIKTISSILNSINIKENLPNKILNKYKLVDLNFAIKNIHRPKDYDSLEDSIRRLKFQELFMYCLKINMLKEYLNNSKKGIAFKLSDKIELLKEKLPFNLTKAQNRVINEILEDQRKGISMNRLVQGDVGSGKTVIAIIAMFNVVDNGYQSVLMAPTEILAKQHYKEVCSLLKDFNVRIELLTSSVTKKNKEIIKEKLVNQDIDILIGTHALIEEGINFKNIGLAVTDEQHRFGVMQRNKLNNKGSNIDTLVMSATPIPRTLNLAIYGDLDISTIDELPPGRKLIDTYWVNKGYRERVYNFAIKQIEEGRQVYIVCPLVEVNEKLSLCSVEEIYDELKSNYFRDINIEILHGKMSNNEKEDVMNRFNSGEIKALVCTTVVEVGVNVPNATLMIIENSERFGLAQLHQLRGRVGRGENKSFCILISYNNSEKTKKRMEIIKNSNDGFYIAEEDLKLRGAGEVFGYRQHGDNGFLLSDIFIDADMLKNAAFEAKNICKSREKEDINFKIRVKEEMKVNTKFICFN
ncbi:ATP-dependent DNA helicase RecG [Haloimpatiens sp. FM7315]|uniref:ATP-dependent DNA helicase RecG n=1 Tax=Haloimpatiens sp. FM7315 TaxID=3298609 RepID=UPI0035A39750